MVVHITLNIFFPHNEGLLIWNYMFVLKLAWYFTEWGRFGYNTPQTEPSTFAFLNEEEKRRLYLNRVKPLFHFILLDSPIIGRVTATAWLQLLRARNSPSPHER